MLQRLLPLWLLLLSGLALWWPRLTTAFDPFLDPVAAFSPALKVLFGAAMFAIGTLLPKQEVNDVFVRWPTVFLGAATQYLVMPLLAFGLALASDLPVDARIGLILAGSVPGAMASNILTLQARGNASYSVSLTTTTTVLSPLVVPLILSLALAGVVSPEELVSLKSKEPVKAGLSTDLDSPKLSDPEETESKNELALSKYFDPVKTGLTLLWTVALPVIAGHLTTRFSQQAEEIAEQVSELFANVAILWIIAVVVAQNRNDFVVSGLLVTILLALNLFGYLAGHTVGRAFGLDEGKSRALTLEVGMQNAGLGAVMARDLFKDRPEVAIPTVLYMFGCMLTGTLLAAYWRGKVTTETAEIGEA